MLLVYEPCHPREGEVDVELLFENRPLAVSEERLRDVIDLLAGEILGTVNRSEFAVDSDSRWRSS